MKIKGRKIEGVNVETIIIPRGSGNDIVMMAQAVLDMADFDKLCPRPEPPKKLMKGGKKVHDFDDAGYRRELDEYGEKRGAYTILKSLQATEDLEWETVNLNDSNTWLNYKQELLDSGFSDREVARIFEGVASANSLSEEKVEAARQRFFASQLAAQVNSSSQMDGQVTTPSGGLASVLE